MEIIDRYLTKTAEHGRPGTALTPKGIVVHYVGNPGSSAEANRNWFENGAGGAYTSAHYIIGLNGEILRCVPENERAMHAGKSYAAAYDGMAKTNNATYLGIECCHSDAAGRFNDATYASLIALCVDIYKRYGFTVSKQVLRHYDVSGKSCPLYYVNNPTAWSQLVSDIAAGTPVSRCTNEPPVLRRGDSGDAVVTMQKILTSAGYSLDSDGKFGPATETVLKAFQAANGLAVDGVCGPKTWSVLTAGKTVAQGEQPSEQPVNQPPTDSGYDTETILAALRAGGVACDETYWRAAMNGTTPINREWLPVLIERANAARLTGNITPDGLKRLLAALTGL